MATSRYEVEYANGVKRVKLLSREDADRLGDAAGIKSLKRAGVSDKQRKPEGDK